MMGNMDYGLAQPSIVFDNRQSFKMVTITTLESSEDILSVLNLQKENLRENISTDEQITDGFLSWKHEPHVLQRMNDAAPAIIAKNSASEVVGYALANLPLPELALEIRELDLLFSWINKLEYEGKPLRDYSYYIMGQVCVKKTYRRQQIFQQMLNKHREIYHDRYQLLITLVSNKNQPSLRAHCGIGFEIIHTLAHETNKDEQWHMICWNWRK